MVSRRYILFFTLIFLSSCSAEPENNSISSSNFLSEDQITEHEQKEFDQYVEERLIQRDSSGKVVTVKGYKESEKLKNHKTKILTDEDLSSLINDSDEMIDFESPDGTEAEVSAPTMIIGSNLFDEKQIELDCPSLAYNKEGASLSHVFSLAMVNNACGKVSVGFCIRISKSTGISADKKLYKYIPTPPIRLTISCNDPYKNIVLPEDVQNTSIDPLLGSVIDELGEAISISNTEYTNNIETSIQFNAPGAEKMYVTSKANCEEDESRDWEPYKDSISSWTLSQSNGLNKVYVKFKQGNTESVCYEDSIVHDDISPTAVTSIDYQFGTSLNQYEPHFSAEGSQDSGSGIESHQISIGISELGEDISAWRLMGNQSSHALDAEISNKLAWGEAYFVNVRAVDKAGNIGPAESRSFSVGYRNIGTQAQATSGASTGQVNSTAVYGNTIVAGFSDEAYDQDGFFIPSAGKVRIYQQNASGISLEATLNAPNPSPNDNFGTSVAVYNDTILVGAPGEDSSNPSPYIYDRNSGPNDSIKPDSGAVYVFRRTQLNDGTSAWILKATLKAPNADAGDLFGHTVAIDGDQIAVGAPGEDNSFRGIFEWTSPTLGSDNGSQDSGAIYIITNKDRIWSHNSLIKGTNMDAGDRFPQSLAFSDNTIVAGSRFIGGHLDTAGNTILPGGAYIFTNQGEGWVQEASLNPDNLNINAYFGTSVAVSGDKVVVGAIGEDNSEGAVYTFQRSGSEWNRHSRLNPTFLSSNDQFAYSLALEGNTLLVGSNQEDSNGATVNGNILNLNNNLENAGSAFVYYLSADNNWDQRTMLKPSNPTQGSYFGSFVCISEYMMLVGSEFNADSLGFGSFYTFGF